VIGSRAAGGAERFYIRLVNALASRNTQTLAISQPDSMVGASLAPGVCQQRVPMRGIWDLWGARRIGQIIRARQPAIVQTYMGRATRLTRLTKAAGPVHVARLGGYYDLKGYRHAHAWVGNTRGIRDYLLERGLPESRVFYIGNFVEIPLPGPADENQQLRADLGIPQTASVLLTVARLHPNKGISDLLQAYARVRQMNQVRDTRLVVVGSGPLEAALREETESLGLGGFVHWQGWQADPAPYYRAADVFICPSRHEPLGNVILEAWSHGLPVLCTETNGGKELVKEGETGWLVPVEDPAALAGKLAWLLAAPEETRQRVGGAGQAVVRGQFNEGTVVDQYLDMYERLRGGVAGRAASTEGQ